MLLKTTQIDSTSIPAYVTETLKYCKGIAVVVALLLLQNGPIDTSPLILPPFRSAAAAVFLAAAVIAPFLLPRLLILLIDEK